jgi:predicted nucleic acid-binding Zn finger protein
MPICGVIGLVCTPKQERCFGTREHMLLVFKFRFKYVSKMLKISDIKFIGYISKFYILTKWFLRKSTFLLSCVKRQILVLKKVVYVMVFFVFFTQVTKNIGFSQNLMYARRKSIRKRGNFCSNFLNISK